MKNKLLLLLVCLLIIPSVFAGSVKRDITENIYGGSAVTSVSSGGSVKVFLTVSDLGTAKAYSFDEIYPSGWTVLDKGELDSSTPGHLKMIVITNPTVKTYTYTLQAPAGVSAGDVSFGGTYMFQGGAVTPIAGVNKLTVVPAGPVCGNIIVESGEECDDNNKNNGDGCSSDCKLECHLENWQKCKAVFPASMWDYPFSVAVSESYNYRITYTGTKLDLKNQQKNPISSGVSPNPYIYGAVNSVGVVYLPSGKSIALVRLADNIVNSMSVPVLNLVQFIKLDSTSLTSQSLSLADNGAVMFQIDNGDYYLLDVVNGVISITDKTTNGNSLTADAFSATNNILVKKDTTGVVFTSKTYVNNLPDLTIKDVQLKSVDKKQQTATIDVLVNSVNGKSLTQKVNVVLAIKNIEKNTFTPTTLSLSTIADLNAGAVVTFSNVPFDYSQGEIQWKASVNDEKVFIEPDYSNNIKIGGASLTSWPAFCGDGEYDGGEGCDDGNKIDGDGCSSLCKAETGSQCTNNYGQKSICTLAPKTYDCNLNDWPVCSLSFSSGDSKTLKVESLELNLQYGNAINGAYQFSLKSAQPQVMLNGYNTFLLSPETHEGIALSFEKSENGKDFFTVTRYKVIDDKVGLDTIGGISIPAIQKEAPYLVFLGSNVYKIVLNKFPGNPTATFSVLKKDSGTWTGPAIGKVDEEINVGMEGFSVKIDSNQQKIFFYKKDDDGDLILNGVDNCVSTKKGKKVSSDGCMFGDRNHDNVVDSKDVIVIKNNPSKFWSEFNGDLKKLNEYLQKMAGNWG